MDPPGAPDDAAAVSYSLWDLYNRLTDGVSGTPAFFTEPETGPTARAVPSLNQFMEAAPMVDDEKGATAAQVVTGQNFWGLRSDGDWGLRTGTLAAQTLDGSSGVMEALSRCGTMRCVIFELRV